MIRQVLQSELSVVEKLIKQDCARNYFVCLGLESSKTPFDSILGEWDEKENLKAVLFKRKTGNLQFYSPGNFDADGFAEYIHNMDFKALIGPSSYCDRFMGRNLFTRVIDGAIIAKLSSQVSSISGHSFLEVKPLRIGDLDQVVKLYEKVFSGFSPKAVMEEKLGKDRGRGVCIRHKGEIVCVVQSEFEMAHSALVVGVATDPDFQGRGLASKCLKVLCSQLLTEGKDLYLQYDNGDAGRIYEKLGFRPIDQVKHYVK